MDFITKCGNEEAIRSIYMAGILRNFDWIHYDFAKVLV